MVFVPGPYKRNSLVGPLMSIIANAAMQKSAQGFNAAEAEKDRQNRNAVLNTRQAWQEQNAETAWNRNEQSAQEAAKRRQVEQVIGQLPPAQQAMYWADPERFQSLVEGTGQPFDVGIRRLMQIQGQPGSGIPTLTPQAGAQGVPSMAPTSQPAPQAPPAPGQSEAQAGAAGAKSLMGRLMPGVMRQQEDENFLDEPPPLVAPGFDYENASLGDLQGRLAELKAKEAADNQEMSQGLDLGEEEQPAEDVELGMDLSTPPEEKPGLFGKFYPGGGGLKSAAQDLALFGGRPGSEKGLTAMQRNLRDPLYQQNKRREYVRKADLINRRLRAALTQAGVDAQLQGRIRNMLARNKTFVDLNAQLMGMEYPVDSPEFNEAVNDIVAEGVRMGNQYLGGGGGGRRRPAAGGGGAPAPQVPAHLKSIYDGLLKRGYDPQDALTEAQNAYDAGVR
jgi:hypothetical protein